MRNGKKEDLICADFFSSEDISEHDVRSPGEGLEEAAVTQLTRFLQVDRTPVHETEMQPIFSVCKVWTPHLFIWKTKIIKYGAEVEQYTGKKTQPRKSKISD